MVMEHIPSGELFKAVSKQGGRVDEAQCRSYMRDIAAAVSYLHAQGIIHRDIKTENILIGSDGALKVADFGTAARCRHTSSKMEDVDGDDLPRVSIACTPFSPSSSKRVGSGNGKTSSASARDGLRYTRCGTPEYLSPEMVAGTGHYAATDAWSLGILIYELLYGKYAALPPPRNPVCTLTYLLLLLFIFVFV
jgi:protein-serine/threonine kinase